MQPGKKKKKSWLTWHFAFIEYYFAHVESFNDCLERPEHGSSLRASVAEPEQIGVTHQSLTPVYSTNT